MGHVDHGKTSLLDAIRDTDTANKEAGGITQHISAYQVKHSDRVITFLDTPGHEAFAALREHGAQLTDVAVIVVAADDGIKPQTKEAINFAKRAGVKMVIAINKIDKPGADPNRVRTELSEVGLTPEEWGGDTVIVDVSAIKKQGLSKLLDMILLVTDIEELKGDIDGNAEGIIIESNMQPGRGPQVRLLVEHGELKVGSIIVAGASFGRLGI
jgi:translation initiation factor IF-2